MDTATLKNHDEPTPVSNLIPALVGKKLLSDRLSEHNKLSDIEKEAYQEKVAAERKRRDDEERAEKSRQIWEEQWTEIAGRFATAKFEEFRLHGSKEDQAEQRRIICEMQKLNLREIVTQGTNLIFIGPPGTGKDHLLFCLLRSCFEQIKGRHGVDYLNGAEFRLTVRKVRREGNADEDQFITKMSRKRILAISDPAPTGGAALTESQADCLYHVFEDRSFKRRSTWITVNLPLGAQLRDEAHRVFTGPLWERMKHESVIVPCNWQSYRKPSRTL